MALAAETLTDPFASGRPRRIKVTCRFCGHGQETWTRRGRWFVCSKCGRRQEGPGAIAALLERSKPAVKTTPAAPTPVKVVAVTTSKPKAVKTPGPPPPTMKKPSKATAPKPPAATPPAGAPKKDLVSRLMGF